MAEVAEIKRGGVKCHVTVKLKAGQGLGMSSVMTLATLHELGLRVGDEVEVAVKAVNV